MNNPPVRISSVVTHALELIKLCAEARATPPESMNCRRACRGCGQVQKMAALKVVDTRLGWSLLCLDCRRSRISDAP